MLADIASAWRSVSTDRLAPYGRAEQAAQNRHCQPDRGQAGMKGGGDDRRRRRTACDVDDTVVSRVAERVSG